MTLDSLELCLHLPPFPRTAPIRFVIHVVGSHDVRFRFRFVRCHRNCHWRSNSNTKDGLTGIAKQTKPNGPDRKRSNALSLRNMLLNTRTFVDRVISATAVRPVLPDFEIASICSSIAFKKAMSAESL